GRHPPRRDQRRAPAPPRPLHHRQVAVVLRGDPQAERALHAVRPLVLLVLAELAGVERLGLDGPALRAPALVLGVVIGVALRPEELHPLALAEQLHRGGAVVDEGVQALGRDAALGEPVEVGAGRLAAVVVPGRPQRRVVRDPDAAAGDRGGAAEPLALVDDQHGHPGVVRGQRGRHPAAAAADDHEVVLVVPVLARLRALPGDRRAAVLARLAHRGSSSRVRNASTALSQADFCSIITQCPQLGKMFTCTLGIVRIGTRAMSTGLTRSSRPQVMRVSALSLWSIAQYGGSSDAAIAFARAAIAFDPYMRRAAARVSGSVACFHRSSIISSVTMRGSYTMECSHRTRPSRVGLSVNSMSSLMPSPGAGLKTFRPMPPIVTRRRIRSGCLRATCVATMPPIELPITSTRGRATPSSNRVTAPPAAVIGCSSVGSLPPNPGNSRTRHRKCSAKRARLPRKFRQPVTPGPDPCSISRGGPSPASW